MNPKKRLDMVEQWVERQRYLIDTHYRLLMDQEVITIQFRLLTEGQHQQLRQQLDQHFMRHILIDVIQYSTPKKKKHAHRPKPKR